MHIESLYSTVSSKGKDLLMNFSVQNHLSVLVLTFVSVINSPLIEVTMIIPTRIKEMCWDQNLTCINKKHS